jgi:hypothetical protein
MGNLPCSLTRALRPLARQFWQLETMHDPKSVAEEPFLVFPDRPLADVVAAGRLAQQTWFVAACSGEESGLDIRVAT